MNTAVVLPFWFDRSPREALDIAGSAEAAGINELWIGEMMTFDAFALAGAIAAQTKHLSLVVGPLAIHLRDPAALALGIASVSMIAQRPVHLALGASTPHVVTQWHGRAWTHAIGHMRESINALRLLLAGERSSFHGQHVRTDGFRLAQPQAATQIAVAAFAPHMIELAARLADRVVLNLVTPQQVARVQEQLATAARSVDRRVPPITVWVAAALDGEEATRAQLVRQLVAYVGAPGYGEMFAAAGFAEIVAFARSGAHPRDVASKIPFELLDAVAALGDTAHRRDRLAAFHQAGAETVAIVPCTATDPGAARLLPLIVAPVDGLDGSRTEQ